MESYATQRRGMGIGKKLLVGAALVGGFLGYGHWRHNVGFEEGARPMKEMELLAQHPVAKGFLAFPSDYAVRARLNGVEETEAYLTNKKTGEELPLSEAAWRLLDAYQQHPDAMEFALTVADKLPGGK